MPNVRPIHLALLAASFVAVVGLAVWALATGDDGSAERNYHFTATLEVSEAADSKPGGRPTPDYFEAWYEDGTGSRWELGYRNPADEWKASTFYRDGDSILLYEGLTNTYTETEIPEPAIPYPGAGPTFSVQLGPMQAATVEEFFERFPNGSWTLTGEQVIAGRSADVYRLEHATNGVSTYWIDWEHQFILRYESVSDGFSYTAVVEAIEFGADVPDGILDFEPPADSQERSSRQAGTGTWSSGVLGAGSYSAPAGFLQPGYLPAGFLLRSEGATQGSNGETTAHRAGLSTSQDQPATLFIEQQYRAGGLPKPIQNATIVKVNGLDAYLTTTYAETTLVWSTDDIIVTLRTSQLQPEELVRIAASMAK